MAKKQKKLDAASTDDAAKSQENAIDEKSSEVLLPETLEEPITQEPKEVLENKELLEDTALKEKIKQEIEKIGLDNDAKVQVQSSANSLNDLDEQKKIQRLLEITKKKGVVFAVKVAQKMNNPYVLDVFHDTLAKNGYYKDLLK